MTEPRFDPALIASMRVMQRGEITEHHIYKKIAAAQKDPRNREVLTRIAQDELGHYGIWKRYTHDDAVPNTPRIWFYYLIARVFGLTFAIKLTPRFNPACHDVGCRYGNVPPAGYPRPWYRIPDEPARNRYGQLEMAAGKGSDQPARD